MTETRMQEGWYILREGAQTGPYTWEALHGLVVAGAFAPDDQVWHESLPAWTTAALVPGLFPGQTAAADPVASPSALRQPTAAPGGVAPSVIRKRRNLLIALIAAAVAVILAGAGVGTYLALRGGGDEVAATSTTTPTSSSMATSTTNVRPPQGVEPDPSLVIDTDRFGPAPANHVIVTLAEGKGQKEAEAVAAELGGTVVGHIDYLGMFQIETSGTTADDLAQAVEKAAALPNVESAGANVVVQLREPIVGQKCSPLRDPLYDGDNSRPYDMIGFQEAWDIIRASGVQLNDIHVGVIDSPIYKESGQGFGTELHFPDENDKHPEGKVKVRSLGSSATTEQPHSSMPGGLSHGTRVTHVLGADPDGGGVVGVLGQAGDKVTMTVSRSTNAIFAAETPDAEDVTQYQGHFWTVLIKLKEQVDNGAKIINCSWGAARVGGHNAWASAACKRFFERMQQDHPDVLFVCAASNEGVGVDAGEDWPAGLSLPNVVTVGALDQTGDRADVRDWWSEEELKKAYEQGKANNTVASETTYEDYVASLRGGSAYATGEGEVTLSACGTRVPVGVDQEGRPITLNGCSFATPQVTAAAALLKSINPELTAEEMKKILVESADTSVEQPDGSKVTVPAEVGGRVLRLDKAVLQVINRQRPENDQFDLKDLIEQATVHLIADGGPDEYTVTTSVTKNPKGCDLRIEMLAEGMISGSTSQRLDGPGEVTWKVSPKTGSATVKVYRSDVGTCAVIQLEVIDLNGHWEGTLTFTKAEVSPELERALLELLASFDEQGCEVEGDPAAALASIRGLAGKSFPLTLDITALEGGTGTLRMDVDLSAAGLSTSGMIDEDVDEVPMTWDGRTITARHEGVSITGTASRPGALPIMDGTFHLFWGESPEESITLSAVWTATKQ